MNDPARWRSPDGGAPSDARELLRHAAAPRALDAAARARNAAAIAKISAGAGAATTTTTLFGAKLAAKVGLAALVAISAGVSLQRVRAHRAPDPVVATARVAPAPAAPLPVAPVVERGARVGAPIAPRVLPAAPEPPRPSTIAAPVALPVLAPAPLEPAPVVAARAHPTIAPLRHDAPTASPASTSVGSAGGYAPPHVVPTMAAPSETLQRETGLIDTAIGSLTSDPQGAFAALERHAREFPNGQMAVEREFLAARLLRSMGREADARDRASALVSRYPSSPYAARARRLFEISP